MIDNKDIIYHILIDRFAGNTLKSSDKNQFEGGNLRGIIENISYLKEMGVSTIFISPFCISNEYHGYHIVDYYEVDPHFGTFDDIKELIDTVHENGMKIISDFVPNHCSDQHPFFIDAKNNKDSKYRKWFYFDKSGSKYKCFLHYRGLPKFNLDNPEVAQYMIDVAKYWYGLGFDAFRIDHAVGPSFSFWSKFVQEMKASFPDCTLLGEVWNLGVKPEHFNTMHLKNKWCKYLFGIDQEQFQKDYIGVLDGVLDFQFANILIDTVKKKENFVDNRRLQNVVDKHFRSYPDHFKLILFMDNHDMERFLFYCDGDKCKLLDAMEFMLSQNKPVSIFYGTEALMHNTTSIYDGKPYSDLKVRESFDKDRIAIYSEIRELINRYRH